MNISLIKENKWLIAICILALLLRVTAALLDPILVRDSIRYITMSETWYYVGSYYDMVSIIGDYEARIPPLFLYLTQLGMNLGITAEQSARGLSLLFGILVVVVGYKISQVVCRNKRISICSALFFALNPILVKYSIQPTREMCYLLWSGLLIYYICCGIRYQKMSSWAIAGFFCAASCATRYEGWEMPLYVIIYFTIAIIIHQYTFKEASFHCTLFIGSLIISLICLNAIMGASSKYLIFMFGCKKLIS